LKPPLHVEYSLSRKPKHVPKPPNHTANPTPSRPSRLGRRPQPLNTPSGNQITSEALKPVRGATLPSKPHGVLRGYMKKQNTIESFDVKKKKATCPLLFVLPFLFASV